MSRKPGGRRRRIEAAPSPRRQLLWLFLFIALLVVVFNLPLKRFFPDRPSVSERPAQTVKSQTVPAPSTQARAKAGGLAACRDLADLFEDFQGRVRVLESARLRGDFGDVSSGRLMKAWDPWAQKFMEELRQVAFMHEMELTPLDKKQVTPVHAAYALVEEACRDVGRAWAQGQGVEGLPALAAAKRALVEAENWLLTDGR